MKVLKKIMIFSMALVTIAVTASTAFAASTYTTPAEAVAALTNKSIDDEVSLRVNSGANYCKQAADAGVLAEFKAEVYEMQKSAYAARVANGSLTQAQADSLLASFKERQATCDGTIAGNCGGGLGLCGGTNRVNAGTGTGAGTGAGYGYGCGNGRRGGGRGHHGGGYCGTANCTLPNCPYHN